MHESGAIELANTKGESGEKVGGDRRRAAHVTRKDGRVLRRVTIYLPLEDYRQLARECAEHEHRMSTVICAALRIRRQSMNKPPGGGQAP